MELSDALRQLIPLQVRIPNPRNPLEMIPHCAAEVFLVDTEHGAAVVWLDAFWCERPQSRVCHIAYATPYRHASGERWIDQDPRYGPRCLAYQKPFIIERLTRTSPLWQEFTGWQAWRAMKGRECARRSAWLRVEDELSGIVTKRLT